MTRPAIRVALISIGIVLTVAANGYAQQAPAGKPSTTQPAKAAFPRPVGYVNDFEGILTNEQVKQLTVLIKKLEQTTTDQVAIVTLTSIAPYDNLDAYALDLANDWGVGQKGKNNGIVIALATGLRRISIRNGYGIESRLTDEETKKIIGEVITPQFSAGNYYEGLRGALEAITKELR